jgi:hypothetical protein
MQRLLIVLLVLASVCSGACKKTHVTDEWQSVAQNLVLSFDSAAPGSPFKRSFELSTGQEFEAQCTIQNDSALTTELCGLVFLNCRQADFEWDGGEARSIHVFHLGPGEERTFDLRSQSLEQGYYDFLLVFFSHPYNHSTDPDWRALSTWAKAYWRANIYVGSCSLPSEEFQSYCQCQDCQSECGSYTVPFLISAQPIVVPAARWSSQVVEAGKRLDYWVNVGNSDNVEESFALIYLLDYQQIPRSPEDETITTGKIAASMQIPLQAGFDAPSEAGLHELVVLRVYRPYAALEDPLGTLTSATMIDSSNRTLIVVIESPT